MIEPVRDEPGSPGRPPGHLPRTTRAGDETVADPRSALSSGTREASIADTNPSSSAAVRPNAADDDAMMATSAGLQPGATLAPSASSQGNQTFGRYQIVGEIAHGSMGVVYKAFDPQLRRLVALKVMITADRPTAEASRRFQKEALMAAKVRHPNIVQVYDVGEVDGKLFFTMELVEGDSLQGIIRKMGVLPTRLALKIARDAARALHAAHQAGLIHRDIKPANLLITPRERFRTEVADAEDTSLQIGDQRTSSFRVLLSDFGIAKDVTSSTMMTKVGTVVGTPAYMSPEQAGEPELIGPRSDVYSLGVVLFHALSGRTPFSDPDIVRLLEQIITKDPPPLRQFAPDVHPDLETIVAKALIKDLNRRYESAEAFANDLDRYLTGEKIQARRAPLTYRAWRWSVRNRIIVLPACAAALVALIMTAYLVAWPRIRAWRDTQRLAVERQAREQDAHDRLARAEQRLAERQTDDAIAEVEALLEKYSASGKRGENVALPEAHDLLARAWTRKRNTGRALLERYRAYRVALGSTGSEQFLMGTVAELIEQSRYDDALALVTRLTRLPMPPEARSQAWFWHGRCLEGIFDFRAALGAFHESLRNPGLSPEQRVTAEAHRDFCAGLARVVPYPTSRQGVQEPDLDLDGTREYVKQDQGDIVLGSLQKCEFVESQRVPIRPDQGFRPGSLWFLEVPDWKQSVAVVRGTFTEAKTDGFRLYRPDGNSLREIASGVIDHGTSAAAMGDTDGDGKPELVFGTPTYDRALRVYDLDEAARTLVQRVRLPIGGDITRIDIVDLDQDRQNEIVVFAAEWGAYGALILKWDPTRREYTVKSRIWFGIPADVVRVPRPGRTPAWIIGNVWHDQMLVPLRAIAGEEFNDKYHPPGAYWLEAGPDLALSIQPILARGWDDSQGGACGTMLFRGPSFEQLWCNYQVAPPSDGSTHGPVPGRHVFRREGEKFIPFTVLLPRLGAGVPLRNGPWPQDMDGDGESELVLQSDEGLVYLDKWDQPLDEALPTSAPAADQGAGLERMALLDFAADADMLGLTEEALSAYQEATAATDNLTELEQALLGQLRCLARLQKWLDLTTVARFHAQRSPPLETVLLREALSLLDQGRRWKEAESIASLLLQAIRLPAEERRRISDRIDALRSLMRQERSLILVGRNAVDLDWLASSPFVATRETDGSFTLHSTTVGDARFSAPVASPGESYRLKLMIEPRRHDWAVDCRILIGASDPFGANPAHSLVLSAGGDTFQPMYRAAISTPLAGIGPPRRTEAWNSPLTLDATVIPHQRRFAGVLEGVDVTPFPFAIEGELPKGDPIFVGFQDGVRSERGYTGEFRLHELELWTIGNRAKPVAWVPRNAAETMMRANGLWIRGRSDEALVAYDQAVQLGDLERTKELAARQLGLASTWTQPSPGGLVPWAALDARFYRGLLRAARGDAAGAQADLSAALALDEARWLLNAFKNLAVLRTRAAETTALRTCWRTAAGNLEGEARMPWIRKTLSATDIHTSALLIEAITVVRLKLPMIRKLPDDGPAQTAGLRPGDVLRAVDGQAITDDAGLKAALRNAALAGHPDALVELFRAGAPARLRVPAQELSLDLQVVDFDQVLLDGK